MLSKNKKISTSFGYTIGTMIERVSNELLTGILKYPKLEESTSNGFFLGIFPTLNSSPEKFDHV